MSSSIQKLGRYLLLSALLTLPIVALLASGYVQAPKHGMVGTGFLQTDMGTYFANAGEYADAGISGLFYNNPFTMESPGERIYFQPMIYLFGQLFRFVHLDLGLTACLLTVFFAWAVFVVAHYFLEEYLALRTRSDWLLVLMFVWGGGCLALAGFVVHKLLGHGTSLWVLDPEYGWWALNWGRSLIYYMEGFYHLLALGIMWAVFRKSTLISIVLLALLSASHPYTGMQYALAYALWVGLEKIYIRSQRITWPQFFMVGAVLLAHLGYYLVFLGSFAEHRSLMTQWILAWEIKLENMVPAYGLVAAGVALRLRTPEFLKAFLAQPFNRWLCCCFVVFFGLANHEFFMTPRQPVHFTRGHIWAVLFLMGVPYWKQLVERIPRRLGLTVLVALTAVFLLDNVLWFKDQIQKGAGVKFFPAEQAVLNAVIQESSDRPIVVSELSKLAFWAVVHSPCRAIYSHPYNTPHAEEKKGPG